MFNQSRRRRAAPLTAALGGIIAVVALLGAVWLIGVQDSTSYAPTEPLTVRQGAFHSVSSSQPLLASTPTPLPETFLAAAEALQQVMINVYARVDPSVVNIEVVTRTRSDEFDGSGSGFVLDTEGHIVTNTHVIYDAREIIVTFRDGYQTRAEVVGMDEFSDLAVIKVRTDPKRLVPVTLGDSSNLQVGQSVIAIGNPFGLVSSMTTGIISATGRTLNSARMISPRTRTPFQNPAIIQVDAQINPGNSGGPLLNIHGEVIGVNTAIRSETGRFQGIGFAVPVNTLKRVVPQLIEKGRADYTWLGIESISPQIGGYGNLTVAALAEQFNLPVDYGVIIASVVPGSPADVAGLRGGTRRVTVRGVSIRLGGDIIVAINDTPIRTFDEMIAYLVTNTSPGDVVKLTIYRGSRRMEVEVTLEARPSE
ncbi:MAG: 2-alkenal reductase [Candidatus Thermofonsia Clade 1 bacterium]|uniref:2-alkenal reductase n=1 Tax=Candidatus Thermofonsia Clade 1 bacterium TaxID=2364210 RepID=A0A2M8NZR9_9CHLR|nr:MAG: 2-alkenal reductase [Candidatus Thermofonsia Clade 1 bacterium]